MRYGLSEQTINKIRGVFAAHPSIEKAVLYGSRAKGNYKPGSDIDLTLYGDALTSRELGDIVEELDDLLLPYQIDLSLFSQIEHVKLKDHIERVGVVFYHRLRTAQIGDLCIINPPKKEVKRILADDSLVSFVPMNNLGVYSKNLNLDSKKKLGECYKSYTYFSEGDVLLAKITPCFENGKIGIARGLENGTGFGSSEYIVLRAKEDVIPEYIFYYLSQKSFRTSGALVMTGAVGHKRIPEEFVSSSRIYLPSLAEQKHIVTILDEAIERIDTAIANTEKNLSNAKNLWKSRLDQIFIQKGSGWRVENVSELCESIVDCVNKTAPVVEEVTPFKMIRTTNIKNGDVNLDYVKHVSEETYKIWTRRQIPQYGDVLLTREAPMGEVGILLSQEHVFLGQRIVSYRTNAERASNWFLYYSLQSRELKEQMRRVASGATVQHIRVPDTSAWKIHTPGIDEQRAIVNELNTLKSKSRSLEELYSTKLITLADLKQSLLQKAFSGELTTDFNPDALEH